MVIRKRILRDRIRKSLVQGLLVASLDTSVDPKHESDPHGTADADTNADDRVATLGVSGIGDRLAAAGARAVGGRSDEGVGCVDLHGKLTRNTALRVQRTGRRLDVLRQVIDELAWNISQPFGEQLGAVTVVGRGSVSLQCVG